MYSIQISETIKDNWRYCTNEHRDISNYSHYKLHIYLPPAYFDAYHKIIYQILKDSVTGDDTKPGIIPSFKILNIGGSAELLAELGDPNKTIQQNVNVRLINNPFTVYLYNDCNLEAIAILCNKLEAALQSIPKCNRTQVSIADLELTDHITFRQENLAGNYVNIAKATDEQLAQLKDEGQNSSEYKKLQEAIKDFKNPHELDPIDEFYIYQLPYYQSIFQNGNINARIRAACMFLECDYDELISKTTDYNKFIGKRYRKTAHKFHPDKNLQKINRAKEITQLLGEAYKILQCLPEHTDISKLFKQQDYLPIHQYELAGGYIADKYYYVQMAFSENSVRLKQYWEDYNSKTESSSPKVEALELANPLPNAKYEPKIVSLPGYQAFYHLFMSDSLSHRLSRGHYEMIFTPNQRHHIFKSNTTLHPWLLEKIVTTAKFINFWGMDPTTLCTLTKQAIQQGIIKIEPTDEQIALYYYKNYPSTLFMALKISPEIIIKQIVSEPTHKQYQLLKLLPKRQLHMCMEHEALHQIIFSSKELTMQLEFFKSFLKTAQIKNCDALSKIIIEQLAYGNPAFLPLLTNTKLNEIKKTIKTNSTFIPIWLCQNIDHELNNRNNNEKIPFPPEKPRFLDNAENPINPQEHIKKLFVNQGNAEILASLNTDTLKWLACEPEMNWAGQLPIVRALIKLNEESIALELLKIIITKWNTCAEQKITIENTSATQLLSELDRFNDQLASINKKLQKEYIDKLITALPKDLTEKCDHIVPQLETLLGKNSQQMIQIYKSFTNLHLTLIESLKSSKKTPELKQKFINLRMNAFTGSYYFIEHNRSLENLMRKIINPTEPYAKEFAQFGIDPIADLMKNFEATFYLYECLGCSEKFYNDLEQCTSEFKTEIMVADKKFFDKDAVKAHFLAFLENELMVYAEGKRNASYGLGYDFEFDGAKQFPELYSLAKRLNIEDKLFNIMVENAYKVLQQKVNDYEPQDYKIERERYIENNPYRHTPPQTDPQPPLTRYIQMRECLSLTDQPKVPELEGVEKLAFQSQLITVVSNQFENVKAGFFSFNEDIIKFHDEIMKFSACKENLDNTKKILALLSTFLKTYSNNDSYNNFLKALAKTPIINDYLGLSTINPNKLNPAKIAKALVDSIDSGNIGILKLPNTFLLENTKAPTLPPSKSVTQKSQSPSLPSDTHAVDNDEYKIYLETIKNLCPNPLNINQTIAEKYIKYLIMKNPLDDGGQTQTELLLLLGAADFTTKREKLSKLGKDYSSAESKPNFHTIIDPRKQFICSEIESNKEIMSLVNKIEYEVYLDSIKNLCPNPLNINQTIVTLYIQYIGMNHIMEDGGQTQADLLLLLGAADFKSKREKFDQLEKDYSIAKSKTNFHQLIDPRKEFICSEVESNKDIMSLVKKILGEDTPQEENCLIM